MDARALFKKLVNDAKKPYTESVAQNPRPIMSYGSQRPSEFERGKKVDGPYARLTDEFIDSLDDTALETEMVLFITRCFRQR